MYEVRLATRKDLKKIDSLFSKTKDKLLENKILQWDEYYPSEKYFEFCISKEEVYILEDNGIVIGTVILNEEPVDEWQKIEWKYQNEKPLVIHGFAIEPAFQDKGYEKALYDFCEEFAIKKDYRVIRLDVFPENAQNVYFWEMRGFEKSGEIFFETRPQKMEVYFCYEKFLG